MAFVLSVEELLIEVSPENPCGVLNAANEAQLSVLDGAVKRASEEDFHKLRRVAEGLFRGGEIPDLSSQKPGATIKAGEIKPVKHLKVAMVLTLTGLVTEGLPGFSDGLVLIEKLLSTQWEKLHPVANPDNETDPYLRRVNLLSPLSVADPKGSRGVPGPVAASDPWRIEQRLFMAELLVSDRHGPLNLRDAISPWATELGIVLSRGEERQADFVHEVRLGASGMLPARREAIQAAINALEAIDQLFKDAPGTIKPKFDYLLKILKTAQAIIDDSITSLVAESSGETKSVTKSIDGSTNKATGPVDSREDAVRKLTEVADYFRRNEPASPVPLLVDRVKRLVGMNFMGLLEELGLGEQAVPEFRKLAGIRDEEQPAESEDKTETETKPGG